MPSGLYGLIRTAPDLAWPEVVAFARRHPESASAGALIEEFVYKHDERFIARIEAAAMADPVIREVVMQAYVGGVATAGAEQFHELQSRLQAMAGWPRDFDE